METGVVFASLALDGDPDCLGPQLQLGTNPGLYQHRAGARTNARGSPAYLLARKWGIHGQNLCANYSTDRPELLHGLKASTSILSPVIVLALSVAMKVERVR